MNYSQLYIPMRTGIMSAMNEVSPEQVLREHSLN